MALIKYFYSVSRNFYYVPALLGLSAGYEIS